MLHFVEFILLAMGLGALAVARASTYVWTPLIAVILGVATFVSHLSLWLLVPLWAIYIGAALLFNLPATRRRYLIEPVFSLLHDTLPPMSETEQAALDAGDVWWEKELFSGRPNWQLLHDLPKPTLSEEEQAFLDNQVETLCAMCDDDAIMRENDLPKEVWDYLLKERFFGMVIDKSYGGLGFSALAHSTIVQKIASRSISTAVTTMVPNSLGPGELLAHYGTKEQKDYYLPRLAKGEEIPCFGLTSPEAGSDAGALIDSGVVCEQTIDGKKTVCIKLNWNKRYITLAPKATLLGLAFQLEDPAHLIGDKTDVGITVALIPSNHPGVETGARHNPMDLAFANGTTKGRDVIIPIDWIIGGKAMAGHGWNMLMECLSIGRAISLPALSTAGAKLAYRTTGIYALARKQFNLSIGHFEGVQEAMARIASLTYVTEATRLLTATAVDLNVKPAIASAIAKYQMTEANRECINAAMDIHGGRAIQKGPRNYLATAYKALPIGITVEGANILTRNLIIFGQGVIRCHPFIRQEMAVAAEKDQKIALKKFDKILCGHIGYSVSNAISALAWGLSCSYLIKSPKRGRVARYYRGVTRLSTAFALVSDVALMILGGELKRKERLSARLADVLSNLYQATAVLKYVHDNEVDEDEWLHASLALETALYQAQEALFGVFANFPNRFVALKLRVMTFPYGRSYKRPSDKLEQRCALSMMEETAFRERLTAHCYINQDASDKIGRMEHGFDVILGARGAQAKIAKAQRERLISRSGNYNEVVEQAHLARVITSEEQQQLLETHRVVNDMLAVDDDGGARTHAPNTMTPSEGESQHVE